MKIFVRFCLFLFLSGGLFAGLLKVPENYSTIQSAIDAATNGDTVLVSPGIYRENINFNGKAIVLASNFIFTKDTSLITQTVIDGDSSESVIVLNQGEDTTSVIVGLTITNGYAEHGGGVRVVDSGVKLLNLKIKGNQALYSGGGIYCQNINMPGTVILRDVEISHNYARRGAGMVVDEWVIMENDRVTFLKNTAKEEGGGILFRGFGVMGFGKIKITLSVFRENQAKLGSGIYAEFKDDNLSISNVLFISNSAQKCGGGIYLLNSNLLLSNITAFNNSAEKGSFLYAQNASARIKNSILWENPTNAIFLTSTYDSSKIAVEYSDLQGGTKSIVLDEKSKLTEFQHNIDLPPSFRNVGSNDFHLSEQSPAIDGGNPADDFSLEPYYHGKRINMGAYGNTLQASRSNPKIFCLPDSLKFSTIERDTVFLKITNVGTTRLNIDSIQLPTSGYSSYLNGDLFILPEDTLSYPIVIEPQASGNLLDSLLIFTNDKDNPICVVYLITGGMDFTQVRHEPVKDFLLPNFPNPFNEQTTIPYGLKQNGKVTIVIYDVLGRKIKTLVQQVQTKGQRFVRWDGTNDQGLVVKSGVYFCRLITERMQQTKKMLLVR